MDFKCFICQKEFDTVDNTITHLKKFHKINNDSRELNCLVNLKYDRTCDYKVKRFDALKKHSIKCAGLNAVHDIEEQVKNRKSNLSKLENYMFLYFLVGRTRFDIKNSSFRESASK